MSRWSAIRKRSTLMSRKWLGPVLFCIAAAKEKKYLQCDTQFRTEWSFRVRAGPLKIATLRKCQEISISTSGQETVVPVAMKLVSPELEFGHLLVGNLQPRGISVGVELAFHRQASGGGSGGN